MNVESMNVSSMDVEHPAPEMILLREMRHRVKNDLQVVISLLLLQAAEESDAGVRARLRETAERVRSLTLFYDRLSRSGDVGCVEAAAYLREICARCEAFHSTARRPLRCVVDAEPMWLPIGTASRLGLIVNELVANSCKHIAAAEREVYVGLSAAPEGGWVLDVSDNGPGLPADLQERRARSLGLRLVEAIVLQLGGMLCVHRGRGTRFTITVPAPAP